MQNAALDTEENMPAVRRVAWLAWCVAMLHMTLSMLQSLPWKISLPLRSNGLVKLEQLYLGTFIQNTVLPHLAGGCS